MDLYEVSIYTKVAFEEIAAIISKFKGIPIGKIGTEDAYYNQLSDDNELEVGISVQHQNKGYRTFVQLVFKNEMIEHDFVEIVCELARELDTDVAIGDITSNSNFATGEYLIITADQHYQKAYEKSNDEDSFELSVYTDKREVSELFDSLQV
jgi:hypothetical protein